VVSILNYPTEKGAFINSDQYDSQLKVCVLGAGIARELFRYDDPVGQSIKVDDQWYEVVGVMQSKALFTETIGELASRDLNSDIYIPLSTFNQRIPRQSFASEGKAVTVRFEQSDQLLPATEVIRNLLNRRHFK
jgi:putative ABC transport system permease protein